MQIQGKGLFLLNRRSEQRPPAATVLRDDMEYADTADTERVRQLSFSQLPAGQAKDALMLLHDLPHLVVLGTVGDTGLLIRYELPFYTLGKIEFALLDQGFHLDNSLLNKLRRALIYYFEILQCQNMTQPEQRERSPRPLGSCHQS